VSWNNISEEGYDLSVTDYNGKCCFRERINEGTMGASVPVQNFAKGIYIVCLENDMHQVKQKFEIR
jgi:hypothetical protein